MDTGTACVCVALQRTAAPAVGLGEQLSIARCSSIHSLPPLQFKDRTVQRTYVAVALGVPRPPAGRVATNIGR